MTLRASDASDGKPTELIASHSRETHAGPTMLYAASLYSCRPIRACLAAATTCPGVSDPSLEHCVLTMAFTRAAGDEPAMLALRIMSAMRAEGVGAISMPLSPGHPW